MIRKIQKNRNVILAFMLGAIGGGILTVVATRAIPKIMASMMKMMMQNMRTRMKDSGFSPSDFCKEMMKNFGESH